MMFEFLKRQFDNVSTCLGVVIEALEGVDMSGDDRQLFGQENQRMRHAALLQRLRSISADNLSALDAVSMASLVGVSIYNNPVSEEAKDLQKAINDMCIRLCLDELLKLPADGVIADELSQPIAKFFCHLLGTVFLIVGSPDRLVQHSNNLRELAGEYGYSTAQWIMSGQEEIELSERFMQLTSVAGSPASGSTGPGLFSWRSTEHVSESPVEELSNYSSLPTMDCDRFDELAASQGVGMAVVTLSKMFLSAILAQPQLPAIPAPLRMLASSSVGALDSQALLTKYNEIRASERQEIIAYLHAELGDKVLPAFNLDGPRAHFDRPAR